MTKEELGKVIRKFYCIADTISDFIDYGLDVPTFTLEDEGIETWNEREERFETIPYKVFEEL